MSQADQQDPIKQIESNFSEAIREVARDSDEARAAPVLATLYTDVVLEMRGVARPKLDVAKLAEAYRKS